MIIDQPISVHISVSSAAEAMWEHQVADFMARLDTPAAEAGGLPFAVPKLGTPKYGPFQRTREFCALMGTSCLTPFLAIGFKGFSP